MLAGILDVGEGQGADPLSLARRNAEHSEQVLGDLIGGLGVVTFRVVVEELAEGEGSAAGEPSTSVNPGSPTRRRQMPVSVPARTVP